MLNKAVIFACKSRALPSWSETSRLSSMAVEPIETIVRLMRSGDWTIRARVREIESVAMTVSEFNASYIWRKPLCSMKFETKRTFFWSTVERSTLRVSMSFTSAICISFVAIRCAVIAAFSVRSSSHLGSSSALRSLIVFSSRSSSASSFATSSRSWMAFVERSRSRKTKGWHCSENLMKLINADKIERVLSGSGR